jgi:hypothetical protein
LASDDDEVGINEMPGPTPKVRANNSTGFLLNCSKASFISWSRDRFDEWPDEELDEAPTFMAAACWAIRSAKMAWLNSGGKLGKLKSLELRPAEPPPFDDDDDDEEPVGILPVANACIAAKSGRRRLSMSLRRSRSNFSMASLLACWAAALSRGLFDDDDEEPPALPELLLPPREVCVMSRPVARLRDSNK